jgi:hypothetical protein
MVATGPSGCGPFAGLALQEVNCVSPKSKRPINRIAGNFGSIPSLPITAFVRTFVRKWYKGVYSQRERPMEPKMNAPIPMDRAASQGVAEGGDIFRLLVESVRDYAIFVLDPGP